MALTTNLGLDKPTVGGDSNTWGTKLNTLIDGLDAVFAAAGTGTSVGVQVGTGKTLVATSGTLLVPAAASPAQTAEGSVVWDTDGDALTVGTGSARKTLVNSDSSVDITGNQLFTSTGAIKIPVGTTAQQPTGVQGYIRYNTTLSRFEGYNGTSWELFGPDLLSGNNRLVNGAMTIDQRNVGAAKTITAGAALAYTVDRWYAYCTGANVTGQQVAGTAPNANNYRFTGAASVTKIGFAQRIEAANSQDLAGQTATLAVDLANSTLTTVTWTAWYATTADSFGTIAVPTRTQIATGTFTVNSTLTRYSTQISIPAAATTGIEIELSVGAQTSGTWTIGRVQFESGVFATPFEARSIARELAMCQRYYTKSWNQNVALGTVTTVNQITAYGRGATGVHLLKDSFKVTMRSTPTVTFYSTNSGASGNVYNSATGDVAVSSIIGNGSNSTGYPVLVTSVAQFDPVFAQYTADAEL